MSYTCSSRKIIRRTLGMMILVSIIVAACGDIGKKEDAQIIPPGDYSTTASPLDLTGVAKLQEFTSLANSSIKSPVAIAQYFPTKNMILALYDGDGYLRTWDASAAKILSEYDLGISSPIGTGFDVSGDIVMGPIRHLIQENDYDEMQDYVGGIGVWSTQTGKLINCVIYPCNKGPSATEWQRDLIVGATLDTKGQWVLANLGTLIHITDITGAETSYSISETNLDDTHRRIALFTFDPSDTRYAVAFRDGGILIEELGVKSLSWFAHKISLGIYEEQSLHEVKALVFSSDGQWLARLQDGILSIWKVSTRSGDLYSEFSISDGKMLAFDRSSELLFVARNDQIDIWNMRKKQLIREIKAPEITSLSVSSDNRLLIWGDKLGEIHIWGVRK